MKTLVACIGNVFFGDDGFGVEVGRRLAAMQLPPDVRLLDIGIRARYLEYELLDGGYEHVILVDAVDRGDPPGTVTLFAPELPAPGHHDPPPDGHSMTLASVLASIGRLSPVPSVVIVGCQPDSLDEGMSLSPIVAGAVSAATAMVVDAISRRETATDARVMRSVGPCV